MHGETIKFEPLIVTKHVSDVLHSLWMSGYCLLNYDKMQFNLRRSKRFGNA